MDNNERQDLLRRLSEVWPKDSEFKIRFVDDLTVNFYVIREHLGEVPLFDLVLWRADFWNGGSILILLDELERRGYEANVHSPRSWTDHDGEYCVTIIAPIGSGRHPKEWMGVQGSKAEFGQTRTEAVVRATLAVLAIPKSANVPVVEAE